MEKLVYLLRERAERPGEELREALLARAVPALRTAGAGRVAVNVHDDAVAAGRPIRRSDPPIRAMVCFWLENADDAGPCQEALAAHGRGLWGYLVAESRPLVHERPTGKRTPGMNQVTCVVRKAGLDDATFFRIWNQDHRVVAVETQSTVGYVRNVVVRPLTEGAPAWDGIVEETFPIGALDDPRVFYDARTQAELEAHMARMVTSCQRFLDLGPLECTPMSEYYLG